MDSIRAAGPLTNTPYIQGSAPTSSSAPNACPQDGFVLSSQNPSARDISALRQLAQGRGNVASAVASVPIPTPSSPNQISTASAGVSETASQADPATPLATSPATAPMANAPSASVAPATTAPSASATPAANAPDVEEVTENLSSAIVISTDTLSEMGAKAGLSAAAGAIVGLAGTVISSIGYGTIGAVQVHRGIRERDPEQLIGGAGNLCDSVSGTAYVVNTATAGLKAGSLGAKIGALAGRIAAPFSLASSAVDFGFGIKDVREGVREHQPLTIAEGALSMAFGVATAASALGGGIPALVISGALLAARCGVALSRFHQAREQAQTPSNAGSAAQPQGLPVTPDTAVHSSNQAQQGASVPQATPASQSPVAPPFTPDSPVPTAAHIPEATTLAPESQVTTTTHTPASPPLTLNPQAQ